MDEQGWARVVAAAVRAPSIHNTQPWIFVAGSDRLELFLDPARVLRVVDPARRQQVISCGAAVEFAVVALRAVGVEAGVELLPDPADPDHLATIRIAGEHTPTEEDRAAADAVPRRHTVRSQFTARELEPGLVDALTDAAEGPGVWVKPIDGEEEAVATAVLLSRAEEQERSDPEYLAELQRWVRSDPDAVDGVLVGATSAEDPATRPSNWLVRDFVAGEREQRPFLPQGDPDAPPPDVERPLVLLLGTWNDDRTAWLDSGRALGRLLLRASAAGVAASPLTQVLDWPAARTQLRSRLSLIGHPQVLLRLGYADDAGARGAVSGRRPVSDVFRFLPD